jgi:hypothetical protein
MNYLPDAAAFGATIVCEVELQRIEPGGRRRWRVIFFPLDAPAGGFAP